VTPPVTPEKPIATPTPTPTPTPSPFSRSTTAKRMPVVNANTVYYEIVLKHDVPGYGWFWLAALLLLIPPIWTTIRSAAFETRRWSTSDYPPTSGGG
jgi:hypothetical protein